MLPIVVIGPVKGVYHIAYELGDGSKYLSIGEFVNKNLAEAIALRMNQERMNSVLVKDGQA